MAPPADLEDGLSREYGGLAQRSNEAEMMRE